MGGIESGGAAGTAEILASIARDYYSWTTSRGYKDCEKEKFPRFTEAVEIGEKLFKEGAKRAMLSVYQKAKALNPDQIWIISKCWDGIGDPNGDMEDIWLD